MGDASSPIASHKQSHGDKWKVIKKGDVPHSSTFHNSTHPTCLTINFLSTKTAQTSHGFDGQQRKSQKRKRSRKGAPLGTAGPEVGKMMQPGET